jgi:hypothetical protein
VSPLRRLGPVIRSGLGRPAWGLAGIVFAAYTALALAFDVSKTAVAFQGDEATYYLMGRSLASDFDLQYRKEDLDRVFPEFPKGPQGVFLKLGQDVTGLRFSKSPPFLHIEGAAHDPKTVDHLYYGKAFIYPLFAAPFVWLLGTKGFYVANAALLAVAVLAAYTFAAARARPAVAALVSLGVVFGAVTPVYASWIAPELFNCTLGLVAYFFWLYKHRLGPGERPGPSWLTGKPSDWIAAGLIGLATYSKVSNMLLLPAIAVWLAFRREWRQLAAVGIAWAVVAGALFGANVAVTGDWNYQGAGVTGAGRSTFYSVDGFPYSGPGVTFETGSVRARTEGRGDAILDPEMFWVNLRANLQYFFVGRYAGLVPYFFPAAFGLAAGVVLWRRREPWWGYVAAAVAAQALLFIISQPYTYFGSGGSVGNRYFVTVYGVCLFLIPPLRSTVAAALPLIVGLFFVWPLVVRPFYHSDLPWKHAEVQPFRLFPPELTNINDLPTMNNRDQMLFWFGVVEPGDVGFQLYYLDGNGYLKESDPSLWIRGEARAEFVIKATDPYRWIEVRAAAGPVPTSITVETGGRAITRALPAGGRESIRLGLGDGFPYKMDRDKAVLMWRLAVTAGAGFFPQQYDPQSRDTRFLGVNVTPRLVK